MNPYTKFAKIFRARLSTEELIELQKLMEDDMHGGLWAAVTDEVFELAPELFGPAPEATPAIVKKSGD